MNNLGFSPYEKMKYKILMILALLGIIVLNGCSSDKGEYNESCLITIAKDSCESNGRNYVRLETRSFMADKYYHGFWCDEGERSEYNVRYHFLEEDYDKCPT